MERVVCEFPPNPNLVLYWTRRQLTLEMKERFSEPASESMPLWIQQLLCISGIQEVDLLRHCVRIRRDPSCSWESLTDSIHSILAHHWEGIEWSSEVASERRWSRSLPECYVSEKRYVFEGVHVAQEHTLGRALFEIPGIIVASIFQETLMLKRAASYEWDEIQASLPSILDETSTDALVLDIQAK